MPLRFPGQFPTDQDAGAAMMLMSSFHGAETALKDAALALHLFELPCLESVPEHIRKRWRFLHARSFVAAVELVAKNVETGALSPLASTATADALYAAVPDLRHVRDAVQHEDERRVLKAKGKAITPPELTGPIRVPPGAVVLDNLINDTYTTMLVSGLQGQVPINRATLDAATVAVQALIDAVTWDGDPYDVEI